MMNKCFGKITKNSTYQIRESKGLKIFSLCFWVLVLFPTLAFAMNLYKTYSSTKNPNYTFQYLDSTVDGISDAKYCMERSLSPQVIKCDVDGVSGFFGTSYTTHYYWQGRVVDRVHDRSCE